MADVSDRAAAARDRGQMLLVAAFGIAVMLVALALILNTSIYTENIATRGSDISGGKDAQRYRAVTEETFRGTVTYVNYNNNSSYADLKTQSRYAVWNYSNISGRHQARDSIVANVSLKRQSEGARIYQFREGDMTNAAGDGNWTVIENTDGVRNFTVQASSLEGKDPNDVSPNHNSPILFANFTDPADDEWYSVNMFEDSSDSSKVWVKVVGHDSYEQACMQDYGPDNRITIEITEGRFNGTDCSALDALDEMYTDDFDLVLNNTDSADLSASYSMVVNSTYGSSTVDPTNGPPYTTRAIYSMNVHLTYESKRLYFETDVRVAPGEPRE